MNAPRGAGRSKASDTTDFIPRVWSLHPYPCHWPLLLHPRSPSKSDGFSLCLKVNPAPPLLGGGTGGVPGWGAWAEHPEPILPPAVLLLSCAGSEGSQEGRAAQHVRGECLQQQLGADSGGGQRALSSADLSLTPRWESLRTPLKATMWTRPLQAGGGGGRGA